MTKNIKFIILLLCVLCTLSLLLIPAFANENITENVTDDVTDDVTDVVTDVVTEPETEVTTEDVAENATEDVVETTTANVNAYATHMIIVKGFNYKDSYIEGEEFSPANLYAKVYYSDGTDKFILTDYLDYLEKGPLTSDITSITFVYDGVKCSFPITVTPTEVPAATLVDIEVATAKTEYLATEKIDPSLFIVTLVYSDETTKEISSDRCLFYPSIDTALTEDITSIAVVYAEGDANLSAIIPVTVLPILHTEISGLENIKLYESSQATNFSGISVTAYYDEAKTISRVIEDFTVAASDIIRPDENGNTKLTVTIGTYSTEVEAKVTSIVNYNITGLNSVYYYGDICLRENIRVYATYADGVTANITNQVVFEIPEVIVAGSKITAYHNDFDLKDFIRVSLPQGELMIVTSPSKLKYEVGESFDSTGLAVGVNYSDGMRKLLTAQDYTIDASSILTAADSFVTINYYGISTNLSISVGDEAYIVSLSIIGSPDVLNYYEGHVLNTSGLFIQAVFSDGTTAIVDHRTLTFTPALNTPLTTDITSVRISANDGTDKYCEVILPITVAEKHPTVLIATSLPKKLSYAEGEIFDPDGLSLSLLFNDMSSIVPSSFSFSPALGTTIVLLSNATEKYIIHVTYEYEGKEYQYPIEITVTPAETENLLVSRYPVKTVYEVGETFDPTGLELILIYKDRSLVSPKVPSGYYSFNPTVIAEDTKEISITFRGITVTVPITVTGIETTPPETTEPEPPVTTEPPEVTTAPPETETEPPITTEPPEVTSEPETTEAEITTAPVETTSTEEITTAEPDQTEQIDPPKSNTASLLYIWVIVIVVIVAALIALIIYYKKNFT